MTVLTPSNAWPNGPFLQHLAGKTATVQSYIFPGAINPSATLAVLTSSEAYPGTSFPQHLTGKTATVQSYIFPGAVPPTVAITVTTDMGGLFEYNAEVLDDDSLLIENLSTILDDDALIFENLTLVKRDSLINTDIITAIHQDGIAAIEALRGVGFDIGVAAETRATILGNINLLSDLVSSVVADVSEIMEFSASINWGSASVSEFNNTVNKHYPADIEIVGGISATGSAPIPFENISNIVLDVSLSEEFTASFFRETGVLSEYIFGIQVQIGNNMEVLMSLCLDINLPIEIVGVLIPMFIIMAIADIAAILSITQDKANLTGEVSDAEFLTVTTGDRPV